MKYFLDTKFIENGETIDLISIGVVTDDKREYYAISTDFDPWRAPEWIVQNVFPPLPDPLAGSMRNYSQWVGTGLQICISDPNFTDEQKGGALLWKSPLQIKEEIREFCNPEKHGEPRFWANYAAYNWVALCQLFGPMINLPKGWPMFCMDLQQWSHHLGYSLPIQGDEKHNALEDARYNKMCWDYLYDQ